MPTPTPADSDRPGPPELPDAALRPPPPPSPSPVADATLAAHVCTSATPPPRTAQAPAPSTRADTRHPDLLPAFLAPIPEPVPGAAAIELDDLSVSVHGRTLWKHTNARIERGQVVLLLGGSGAGKSVLIRILLGLITPGTPGFSITGRVRVNGTDLFASLRGRAAARQIGLVFQDYALFDELSVARNLSFAFDHAVRPWPRAERAEMRKTLVSALRLPIGTPITRCSGGERRRIAIARTLAFDPDILLFDEPTSGLDPQNAAIVAQLIATIHQRFAKTSLIVTHDYEALPQVADRVLVHDPERQALVELAPERTTRAELCARLERGHDTPAPAARPLKQLAAVVAATVLALGVLGATLAALDVAGGGPGLALSLAGLLAGALGLWATMRTPARPWRVAEFLVGTSRALERVVLFPLALLHLPLAVLTAPLAPLIPQRLRLWPRPRWGLFYLQYFLRVIAFGTSLLYLGAAGLIVGFVTTYFTFAYFPYADYTEPLIFDDVMAAVGFLLWRVLIPLVGAVLLAARSGAAVAADLGNRVYQSQDQALRTFNVTPFAYWSSPVLWGFLVGGPVLILIASLTATLASLAAFLVVKAGTDPTPLQWWIAFSRDLVPSGDPHLWGTLWRWPDGKFPEPHLFWITTKTLASVAVTAVVATVIGRREKRAGPDITRGVTQTILWATLGVLLVHVIFAFFEFIPRS